MTEVQSKALKSTIKVNRIISEIHGHEKGPTVVFFGGIHGNEVAGVFAIEKVLNNLLESKTAINGSIYGIAGNLQALGSNHRFIEKDLNRLWTFDHIYNAHENLRANEDNEQQDLLDLIEDIIFHNHPPFYFIDIHTTSSQSIPFITINDALINRKFSELFPLPVVLGIEEYLEGPLLSYINE
ncbi:MAG TPA: succinylglutamate desuccinylase/aspartoacylase family protein, partial [Mangrovimonas sp.]|nr:succinylglutamate desuccinylase/aspartoacylase family protein [Mangrovimonas sp.]